MRITREVHQISEKVVVSLAQKAGPGQCRVFNILMCGCVRGVLPGGTFLCVSAFQPPLTHGWSQNGPLVNFLMF